MVVGFIQKQEQQKHVFYNKLEQKSLAKIDLMFGFLHEYV